MFIYDGNDLKESVIIVRKTHSMTNSPAPRGKNLTLCQAYEHFTLKSVNTN